MALFPKMKSIYSLMGVAIICLSSCSFDGHYVREDRFAHSNAWANSKGVKEALRNLEESYVKLVTAENRFPNLESNSEEGFATSVSYWINNDAVVKEFEDSVIYLRDVIERHFSSSEKAKFQVSQVLQTLYQKYSVAYFSLPYALFLKEGMSGHIQMKEYSTGRKLTIYARWRLRPNKTRLGDRYKAEKRTCHGCCLVISCTPT